MKINSVKYFMKEAGRNVFSNGWMSVASMFTVVASLLVFGIFMVLALNVNHMVDKQEKDYEITLTVDENCTQEETEQLGRNLAAVTNVSEVIFESKEVRMEYLRERFGEDAALLDAYQGEENPLRNWYKIRCEDLNLSDDTVAIIKELNGVARVISSGETINKLTTVSKYISTASIWIMLALAVISIFIIANTIKLAVFSRRKEINIMKYVGATDWFIRWPFIIEGMIIGLLGAIASGLFIALSYEGIIGVFATLKIAFMDFIPLNDIMAYIGAIFLLMGLGLGALGSLIAVRKHLKV
ncbi:MAG: permease-like cell division protein FtsX [Clostridia bacterium]|nr:permease-like cell division protein FtsX [Clostridia bacterium]